MADLYERFSEQLGRPDDEGDEHPSRSPVAKDRDRIIHSGSIVLREAVAATTVDGDPGIRDEALSSDGRYLYALHADSGQVFGWEVGTDRALGSTRLCQRPAPDGGGPGRELAEVRIRRAIGQVARRTH